VIAPPVLQRNEVLLITDEKDATSVLQGEDGFLLFRQWCLESMRGEKIWRVKNDLMVGSKGRNSLIALIAADPKAEIWRGEIIAEAATPFKNGYKSAWAGPLTLDAAKAWVEAKVSRLLGESEQLSQAFVAMPGDEVTYEFDPSTWGSSHPRWYSWEEGP